MLSDAANWLCAATVCTFWRPWLPEDPTLRLAVYSALALGLLTFVLMMQILLLSEIANRRLIRRQRFNEHWRAFFAARSLGEPLPEPTPTVPRRQHLWFLLLWNRTQLQVRGQARERMNMTLVTMGFEPIVVSLLRSRIRNRLVALSTLRFLGDVRHWEAVQSLLQHRNPILVLSATQTLIAMDPSRAIRRLLAVAEDRNDLALPRLASLCQQAGRAAVTPALLDVLLGAHETFRERMAALVGWADPRVMAGWARHYLDHGGTTVQLKASLRCVGELAEPVDRERILRMLGHPDPEVRLSAIKRFGALARKNEAHKIIPLLYDANWWVRQAAADALAGLPGVDMEQLARIIATITDPYGQDAMRRAVAEMRE